MSCKYSSTMILLVSSSLYLCLLCQSPTVVSCAGIYARFNNIIFTNRAWVPNDEPAIQTRSGVGPPERDLQRPQQEREPTVQETWNGHRNAAQRPVAAADSAPESAPSPAPARAPARAPVASAQAPPPAAAAPLPGPVVTTVQGIDVPAGRPTAAAGPARPPAQYNYRERFSSALFQPISRSNPQNNVVYSPSSVHAMLGMLYGVSSGQTASELQRAGQFSDDKLSVAMDFQRLNKQGRALENALLIVANKLYYNRELSELNPDYSRYAREFYSSEIEAVNMKRSANTAARINAWASDATRNIINQLVSSSDIDEQTEALLVNAIYFKARWANEFSAMDTTPEKFQVNRNAAMTVSMMYNDDVFPYAELPELDATALELPYAGTEATMLLILPNQVEGLPKLERQLASTNHDLNAIAARLRRETVTVRLPKFRIEFEQDMVEPLQQLGVRRMFTPDSQVNAMLMRPVRVSKILQKAFIDVNEAGSEAAAASYAKFVPLSLPVKSREFTADHPFLFAIRTTDTVLFIGHVVQPSRVAATTQ